MRPKKTQQQQQARHLMVSNGWAQLMKAWQISVTAGGRRTTTGGGKKKSCQSRLGFQSQGKALWQTVPVGMCLWSSALRVHRPQIGSSIPGSISQNPGRVILTLAMVFWPSRMSSARLGIWGTLGNGGGWSQPLLGASRRALITS